KEKALANVRAIALTGTQPPNATMWLVTVANGCGDPVLGLALTESALRAKPDNRELLGWKLDLETGLGTLDRADATAQACAAAPGCKAPQPPRPGAPLMNPARAYRHAGRPADALRWCDWLHERLTSAGAERTGPASAWDSLGVVYWQLKRYDRSIPIYEQ